MYAEHYLDILWSLSHDSDPNNVNNVHQFQPCTAYIKVHKYN